MRVVRGALVVLVAVLGLPGCAAAPGPRPVAATSAASSPSYGAVFLGVGECGTRGPVFREVSCGSEKAAARVLGRYAGRPVGRPLCPAVTDYVLHITLDAAAPGDRRGYACMRNLEPPHPGDPGGGGGPHTVVGDCLDGSRGGQVRETACDGSGERPPEFQVVAAVEHRSRCPAGTDLYVRLGGERAVGCAHRL
ncbi:hypothetical protein ACFPM3_00080 [Streptomyces coeruleoprunus]|uniref:Lipoprotein n=1 Tax=Streptomyces coeruleoprunus TaxID=285563 RepID=A0ABV9X5M4_9ACTN